MNPCSSSPSDSPTEQTGVRTWAVGEAVHGHRLLVGAEAVVALGEGAASEDAHGVRQALKGAGVMARAVLN